MEVAAALSTRAPQAGIFAPEDFEVEIEVWPENWRAVQIFAALGTQWVHGMAGPVGLNYASVLATLERRYRLSGDDLDDVFDAISVMERAALQQIHSKAT